MYYLRQCAVLHCAAWKWIDALIQLSWGEQWIMFYFYCTVYRLSNPTRTFGSWSSSHYSRRRNRWASVHLPGSPRIEAWGYWCLISGSHFKVQHNNCHSCYQYQLLLSHYYSLLLDFNVSRSTNSIAFLYLLIKNKSMIEHRVHPPPPTTRHHMISYQPGDGERNSTHPRAELLVAHSSAFISASSFSCATAAAANRQDERQQQLTAAGRHPQVRACGRACVSQTASRFATDFNSFETLFLRLFSIDLWFVFIIVLLNSTWTMTMTRRRRKQKGEEKEATAMADRACAAATTTTVAVALLAAAILGN